MMSSSRLEAFSDGVIAIIITIMVLELHAPTSEDPRALLELWPVFLSYILSFMMVAIYWMNHHYMFHSVKHVHNGVLWANILLLFTLSLIPFVTAYMGEQHISSFSVALEAFVLFLCGVVYFVLYSTVRDQLVEHGNSQTAVASTSNKHIIAMVIYLIAMAVAFANANIALFLLFAVAAMYIAPGRQTPAEKSAI
jgi:uncharacterized membrane protein